MATKTIDVLNEGLMTISQVAEFLQLERNSVSRLIKHGKLPRVEPGSRGLRVPRAAVLDYARAKLAPAK